MLHRAQGGLRAALVTGACSGIGRALARRLGSLGYDVVLVSNRRTPLQEAAAEIEREHGVRTWSLEFDLARPDAAQALHSSVRDHGIQVDILVNNAGVFFFGEIVDADPARAAALLQLHVGTPSLLCTLFGHDLRERRRGHVLIVSSIAAWRDFPGIGYYGSSKKYLRGFACALRSELAVYGVGVTCLAPGPTLTGLYDQEGAAVRWAQRLGVMMSAEEVAEAGLEAMFAGKAECVPGRLARVLAAAGAAMPQASIDVLRWHAPWMRR